MDNFKITAQQAKTIDNFMNAKQKLLKTKAAIRFNTICMANGLQYVGTFWSVHPLNR
jgi:hypothetical protein